MFKNVNCLSPIPASMHSAALCDSTDSHCYHLLWLLAISQSYSRQLLSSILPTKLCDPVGRIECFLFPSCLQTCRGCSRNTCQKKYRKFLLQINFVHHFSLEIASQHCWIQLPFLTVPLHGLVLLAPSPWMTSSQLESSIKLSFSYSFHPGLPGPIVLSFGTHSKLGKNATSFINPFLIFIDHSWSLPSVNTLPFCFCLLVLGDFCFVCTDICICLLDSNDCFRPSGPTLLNRYEFSTFHQLYSWCWGLANQN